MDNQIPEIEELIKSVRGPDFPTGGTIMGKEGIINAYTTYHRKYKSNRSFQGKI